MYKVLLMVLFFDFEDGIGVAPVAQFMSPRACLDVAYEMNHDPMTPPNALYFCNTVLDT